MLRNFAILALCGAVMSVANMRYKDSFYISGFWLGTEENDIFIATEEKGAFVYPNQVFYFPRGDWGILRALTRGSISSIASLTTQFRIMEKLCII